MTCNNCSNWLLATVVKIVARYSSKEFGVGGLQLVKIPSNYSCKVGDRAYTF